MEVLVANAFSSHADLAMATKDMDLLANLYLNFVAAMTICDSQSLPSRPFPILQRQSMALDLFRRHLETVKRLCDVVWQLHLKLDNK
jgi:hypothetical protein